MTTYRLFPSTSGPSSPVSYTGNILIGVIFKVTQGGMWFSGYWKWVATGEDTTARKFALWQITGASTGSLIPAATVTSGTLTANSWNFVPLATPIPLAIGTAYNACTGWAAVSGHGFSDSDTSGAGTGATDSFGSGGHSTGITNGPLFAYSDQPSNGTKPEPYGTPQGVFSVAGTDASVNMPGTGSNSGNFWMDVQVSDTGPADYSGSYRLWPTKVDANGGTTTDASVNYEVATEFALSQACTLNKIWYYSPTGATQLATSASIWSVTAPGTSGTQVFTNTSPSWSGVAASGWLSIAVTGVTLPPGKYKVGVYNGAGSPAAAFAKDSQTDYWRNGDGANGITWGPISAPNLSSASTAFNYNGNAGGSPPFSDGTTLAGQSTFTQGPPDAYPYLVALVTTPAAGSTQNYWVDAEVTPLVADASQPPKVPPELLEQLLLAAPKRWSNDAGSVTVPGTATLAAAGSIAAPASQGSGGTLSGTGSLNAPDVIQRAGATLAATGVAGTPGVIQGAGATLAGMASLSTAAVQQAGASLTAAGSLTAGVTQQAGATLAAAGSLTGSASQAAGASLAASGSLAAPDGTQAAGAALSGSASLTAPDSTQAAGASLAAAGSLAASAGLGAGASLTAAGAVGPSATQQAGAALAAEGALSTAATLKAGAVLAGTGSIFASPGGQTPGAAALAAAGSLTAPAGTQGAGASLAATGTLAAPESVLQAAAVLAAVGLLTAGSEQEAGAELISAGSVTATASSGGGSDRSRGFLGVFP